jgi:uncharacterized membrane protein YvbJ
VLLWLREYKNMKKELVFPLIAGIVLGVLVMLFWQLGARMNNNSMRLAQLEQATAQNSQALGEIVAFINQATGQGQEQAAPVTPAQ